MAKRKRKSPRRRNRKGLSAAPRRRRSSARRSKGFLSDMFNPTVSKNSAITSLSGGAGGLGAIVAHKFLPATGAAKLMRIGAALGVGFIAATLGKPNVGAGFAGGLMALSFQNGLLADGADYANENSLMDGPIWLDENDQPMTLEEGEDGPQLRYLSDDEIDVLHESGAFSDFEVVS